MPAWSPEVANEFIRRAAQDGRALTQMQLQKLVYIAHGWNLAITGQPLTNDEPEAWDYGPVYREIRRALRNYGRECVNREIRNSEFVPGVFEEDESAPANAVFNPNETAVIDRVYRDYGGFHAFQLSALTHRDGTPWTQVYDKGNGKFSVIPTEMIRSHFVDLATQNRPHNG